MFSQLKSLFLRYRAKHLEFSVPGFPLDSETGQVVGNIDRIIVKNQCISFHGWCCADHVSLVTNGGGVDRATPSIFRKDVSDRHGGSSHVGFCLSEAIGNGRYTLRVDRKEKDCAPYHIRPVSQQRWVRANAALSLRFLATLFRAAPSILRWWIQKDPVALMHAKSQLGLNVLPVRNALDPALFAREQVAHPSRVHCDGITIVLPVFNAFDLLPEVLSRVVANTDVPWRLIIIEDCSTDPDLRQWLRDWVQKQRRGPQISLLENAENLGFIKSVNKGLKHAIPFGQHVVLLNSDAFVPKDWASRLLAPILADPLVASATPMSNDGEIVSVPGICEATSLQAGQADHIDRAAQGLLAAAEIDMPTGVGFCMAMNIAFLKKHPQLDTVFGRGYGEEVDWCQVARKKNGRHVAVANLFVEHRGGASFGSSAKQKLIAENNCIIRKRYPKYDLDVQNFITSDPLRTPRLALAVAWAGQQAGERAVPIYLAHSLGGGADLYQQQKMQKDWFEAELPSIVLRVGGAQRWQVEVIFGDQRCCGTLQDIRDVSRLLSSLKTRRIIYSCGVGDSNPVELPGVALSLKSSDQDEVDLLVHDYFMISPNYTLLNDQGVFEGLASLSNRSFGRSKGRQEWRSAWGDLARQSNRVIVFSQSSRDIFLAAYPLARQKIVLAPHSPLAEIPRLPLPNRDKQKQVIAVLGNIGFHKGAQVVCDLGRLLQKQDGISLIVLGEFDPMYEVPKNVHVHGGYELNSLPELAVRYQVTDWFIPSIWPETFSYTTHEALATGLTTYAYSLGAQGDAVASRENGRTIDYSDGKNLAAKAFRFFEAEAQSYGQHPQQTARL